MRCDAMQLQIHGHPPSAQTKVRYLVEIAWGRRTGQRGDRTTARLRIGVADIAIRMVHRHEGTVPPMAQLSSLHTRYMRSPRFGVRAQWRGLLFIGCY